MCLHFYSLQSLGAFTPTIGEMALASGPPFLKHTVLTRFLCHFPESRCCSLPLVLNF